MKTCSKCRQPKDVGNFCKSARMKDGLQSWCKACMTKNTLKRYRKDKIRFKTRNTRYKRDKCAKVYEYLQNYKCVDCGEDRVAVLEFDHLDPTKKIAEVSTLCFGYSWEIILAEIKKCDVVCANCHKLRTAHRAGWQKLEY